MGFCHIWCHKVFSSKHVPREDLGGLLSGLLPACVPLLLLLLCGTEWVLGLPKKSKSMKARKSRTALVGPLPGRERASVLTRPRKQRTPHQSLGKRKR